MLKVNLEKGQLCLLITNNKTLVLYEYTINVIIMISVSNYFYKN